MAYTMQWHVSNRVIYIRYYDDVTLEDLQQVNEEFKIYRAEGNAPIHVISDLQTNKYPTNFKGLRDVFSTLKQPDWGWFIIIGVDNALARFLLQLLSKAFNMQTNLVDSLEAATEVLKRVDLTLNESVD